MIGRFETETIRFIFGKMLSDLFVSESKTIEDIVNSNAFNFAVGTSDQWLSLSNIDSMAFYPYNCHLPNLTANGIKTMNDLRHGRAAIKGDSIVRPGTGGNGFSFDERNDLRVKNQYGTQLVKSSYSSTLKTALTDLTGLPLTTVSSPAKSRPSSAGTPKK